MIPFTEEISINPVTKKPFYRASWKHGKREYDFCAQMMIEILDLKILREKATASYERTRKLTSSSLN